MFNTKVIAMRRTALATLLALLLFGNLVSADYIAIKQFGVFQSFNDTSITVQLDYSFSGKTKIRLNFYTVYTSTEAGSIYVTYTFDTVELKLKLYYNADTDYTTMEVYEGSDQRYSGPSGEDTSPPKYAEIEIDPSAGTITITGGGSKRWGSWTGSYTVNSLTSIRVEDTAGSSTRTAELETITISKYSQYTKLTVYDEDSLTILNDFDFSEHGDSITVTANNYVSRSYYLNNVTELEAFLLKWYDAGYYTVSVEGAGEGTLVEALRGYGAQKKVVAQAKTDGSGKASMVLKNSKLYTFRVYYGNSTLKVSKIADPNNPIIYISPSLIGKVYVNETGQAIAWTPDNDMINENTTAVSVTIADPSNSIQNATLVVESGTFKNVEVLTGSPSGGELSITLPGLESLANTVKATLTIYRAGTTYNYTKVYMVDKQFSSDFSLDSATSQAQTAWGLGKLGMLLAGAIIAIIIANALGARGAGLLFIVLIVYTYFGYKGWIDRDIAIMGLLGGLGMLLRRREV